jgi:hypothetical protein
LIGPEKGVANRAETRCNARLWQGRETAETGDLAPSRLGRTAEKAPLRLKKKMPQRNRIVPHGTKNKGPGWRPGPFIGTNVRDRLPGSGGWLE